MYRYILICETDSKRAHETWIQNTHFMQSEVVANAESPTTVSTNDRIYEYKKSFELRRAFCVKANFAVGGRAFNPDELRNLDFHNIVANPTAKTLNVAVAKPAVFKFAEKFFDACQRR